MSAERERPPVLYMLRKSCAVAVTSIAGLAWGNLASLVLHKPVIYMA